MNHQEAKATILRILPSLTDAQRLVTQGISFLETKYGNWGPDPLRGAGSNNMGAVTDPSYHAVEFGPPAPPNASQFLHTDSRHATPKEILAGKPAIISYTTAFRKYPSPEAGFQDVARVALKANVNDAISKGDLYGVSSAMHKNVYYTGTLPTAKQNIDAHNRALSIAVNNILAATGDMNPFVQPQLGQPSGGSATAAIPLAPALSPSQPLQPSSILPSTLRSGSLGSYVKVWQRILGVSVDGVFGRKTEVATRIYQAAQGLKPDGVVGPLTWRTSGQVIKDA